MSQATPRVSVVVPAYNVADTLEKAVDSILAQTEHDLEVVIVDDCSRDETKAVAARIAARDARVRLVALAQNGGRSVAVNRGLDAASGTWIAVLDGDDWFEPARLRTLIAAAEADGTVQMASDNQNFIDIDTGAHLGTAFPPGRGNRILDLDAFLKASNPTERFDYGMLKPVLRADFMRAHRVANYEPARTGEDWYFHLEFYAAGGRNLVVDRALYNYIPPSGTVLREMARAGRKRYSYDTTLAMHAHYTALLHDRLTPQQRHWMRRRAQGVEAMQRYVLIRDSAYQGHWRQMLGEVFATSPRLWPRIVKRTLRPVLVRLGA